MFKHLTTKTVIAAGAATLAISAVSTPAEAASFTVTVEAPGVQTSQVTGTNKLTENFNSLSTGNGAFPFFFNTNPAIGTYSTADTSTVIQPASVVGGAGGTGNFLAVASGPVTLNLNTPQKYFGLWWSAVDAANKIEFFKGGTSLFSFDTPTLVSYLAGNPGYIGNPNFPLPNSSEPFAFVNFFAGTGTDFDEIRFTNSSNVSFFESDNHTIAETFDNTPGNPLVVPTPAMLPGLISMGIAAWRKRKAEAAESEV